MIRKTTIFDITEKSKFFTYMMQSPLYKLAYQVEILTIPSYKKTSILTCKRKMKFITFGIAYIQKKYRKLDNKTIYLLHKLTVAYKEFFHLDQSEQAR